MREVLVVVDMQRAYEDGPWKVLNMRGIERNILQMIPWASEVIFTRHVPDAQPKGTWKTYNAKWGYVEEDPRNGELVPSLAPAARQCIEKSTYSAFGSQAFRQLIEGADRLIVTGIQTECCVLATILDAVDAGIEVMYVRDACSGKNEGLERATEEILKRLSIHVTCLDAQEWIDDQKKKKAAR